MIADALQNITNHSGIKKANRQSHQFGEKIGNQGNIDPRAEVQHNPTLNKFNRRLSGKKHELCPQNEVHKIDVSISNTTINHRLSQKWKNQHQHGSNQHAERQLNHKFLVGFDVF